MRNIKKLAMLFFGVLFLSHEATADALDNKISNECKILALFAKSAKESLHAGMPKQWFIEGIDSFSKWEGRTIVSREMFLELVEKVYREGEYDVKTVLENLKSTPNAVATLDRFKNASKEQQEMAKAKILPQLIQQYSDGVYKNCMNETMKLLQKVKEQSQH